MLKWLMWRQQVRASIPTSDFLNPIAMNAKVDARKTVRAKGDDFAYTCGTYFIMLQLS